MSAAGYGHPPHVAQRSRRDKLRFHHLAGADALHAYGPDAVLDFALPPAAPGHEHTQLGYFAAAHGGVHELLSSGAQLDHGHLGLHEVVNRNHALELSSVVTQQPAAAAAGGELWLPLQYETAAPWPAPRAKVEQEGFAPFGSQALSLTLSSNPAALQELPAAYGGSLQSVVGSSTVAAEAGRGAAVAAAAVGPLGPFTGYAAVLKSSRFLKPAQQLLDELSCAVAGVRVAAIAAAGTGDGERSSSCGRVLEDLVMEHGGSGAGGNSVASSSSLNSSTEGGGERPEGSSAGGRVQHQRAPEFQQKKAKLLYMQEEVCKRYKQYQQQMQMVVSSFESVPGLSSATPYASLAVKAISKQFCRLKSIISNQIQHLSGLLGEEIMSLPSSSGGRTAPRIGFMEQSQPVWRPQRGLPERAVSVLRAWLFDHFLHPYPTDTDKHMLATQTGLSRNQVSNWFINARVRLWKPMVEEIHMLETRGSSTMDQNSSTGDDGSSHATTTAAATAGRRLPPDNQMLEACCNAVDYPSMESMFRDKINAPVPSEAWHCDKRSRVQDCNGIQGGGGVGGGGHMMSFAAPFAGRMDVGGFAPVSLTLGLRHDGSYQQQHQQQQHFGSQIFRG